MEGLKPDKLLAALFISLSLAASTCASPPPGAEDAPRAETVLAAAAETSFSGAAPVLTVPASQEPAPPGRNIIAPVLAVFPENPRPGEPFVAALVLPGGFIRPETGTVNSAPRAVLVSPGGERLGKAAFFTLDEKSPGPDANAALLAALLTIPSTMRAGLAKVVVEGITGLEGKELGIAVPEREFGSETIDLDERNTAIRTEPDPQKTGEANRLWAILNRTGSSIYAEEAFAAPVTVTRRTSFFGDRRMFRYVTGATEASVHAGIDYGAPRGTPVTSCAPGKVILARSRIVTGNSVIIEHLPGVYSLYYHMDSLGVNEGELVETGTLLGLSGSTGLATGPHLHWEIRVAGENADPDVFMARPLLDKNAIFSKLNW
ncbi:MAG: M23 family metallopeptidase [Treponema sp.]|nr:M23 family metallopeptidase [Treponema sp.]